VQRYAAENGSVSIIHWNVRLGSASIRLKSITQKVSNIELSFAPVHATLKD
jgi:hypothetical protein